MTVTTTTVNPKSSSWHLALHTAPQPQNGPSVVGIISGNILGTIFEYRISKDILNCFDKIRL